MGRKAILEGGKRDEIIADYEPVAEKAMRILDEGFEDSMTVMTLPKHTQIILRSTNILERLNRELKRRSDVIQAFPNTASVLRLMGAVTLEHSERQSTVQRIFSEKKFVEIRHRMVEELRQIAARQVALLTAA